MLTPAFSTEQNCAQAAKIQQQLITRPKRVKFDVIYVLASIH